ncbi:peptidase dimerization domain-containing protein, partial [Psychrobacter sp. 16-MNA-CIBAN-0192]
EEVGCLGAPLILADIKARGITPDYCIVGEPTNMAMVVAHKGISIYRCRVHGKSAHSSLTAQGVNAISYASRLIGYV